MTIQEAIEHYLKQVKRSKSKLTAIAYERGLSAFATCMAENEAKIDFLQVDIKTLSPQWLEIFLNKLQKNAVATEQLYTTAVSEFFRYVTAQEWAKPNLATLDFEMSQRRKQGKRLHIFPEDKLEQLLFYIEKKEPPTKPLAARLTMYRDKALLITLADTGLRVSELCSLRKKDLDYKRNRAVIIGKGNKQALVRFSKRAIKHIENYLLVRFVVDKTEGRLDILPIFARHDKRVSKRILPISTRTAEKIVSKYVVELLGEEARGIITPHTFRHYFVTRAVRNQNILFAQHLARHESINTTTGYTHLTETEIDNAYETVFNNQT